VRFSHRVCLTRVALREICARCGEDELEKCDDQTLFCD
jgi:hypothetical protein